MRLYVGNLPFEMNESEVKELCGGKGRQVKAVKLISDRETGRSRGFAFVDFDTAEEGNAAIAELNGMDVGGRALKVNEAEEKPTGATGSKFGGGGGFRGTPHGKGDRGGQSGFGMRGPAQNMPRGSQRGGGRGGSRGS